MTASPVLKKLSLLTIALIPFLGFSQTRFVTTGGDDQLGANDCTNAGTPCRTITQAISQASPLGGDVIQVAAGTYTEDIIIDRSLTINGANQGTSGNGSRLSESIIVSLTQTSAIEIDADNVTVDGVQVGTAGLDVGIATISNTGITIQNSVINADSVGISFLTATTGTINITDNLITMSDFRTTSTSTPTAGIYLSGLTGDVDANLSDNNYSGGAHGILVFDCVSSNILSILNDTITSSIRGMSVFSTDGVSRGPSTVNVDGMSASSFSEPSGGIGGFPEAGIYFYSDGSSDATHTLTGVINNSTFDGVGSTTSDYSGIICGNFSTTALQSITVTECNFQNNENRGFYARGDNTNVSVQRSTFNNNGFDPVGTGGNHGFNVVVRNNATLNAANCFFTNPSTQNSDQFDGLSLQSGSSLTISNSHFNQNGNGLIAGSSGINLSGNYLGSDTEATILGFISGAVDFTPYLGSATDTEPGTVGFQPDLSTVHVTASGSQSFGTILQDGHDLVNTSGTLIASFADYTETLTVSKNLLLRPLSSGGNDTSLDNLVMNGTGATLTMDGNLLINTAVTLTDGNIDVNTGELRLGTSATDLSESSSSQVTGNVTMDPRSVGAGSFSLLGVDIAANASDDIGNITVVRQTGMDGIIADGPNTSVAINWDITVDNQPIVGGRDVTFTWLPDFDNAKDVTSLAAFRNDNVGSGWVEVSVVDADATTVNGLSGVRSIMASGVTEFSQWTMAEAANPLPVELAYFTATPIDQSVRLDWTTMTEINSDHFEIQKSLDGIEFSSLGKVASHGNSTKRIDYQWVDNRPVSSTFNYYRLKMVDVDGTFEYSPTVQATVGALPSLKIYPNPTTHTLFIDYPSASLDYFIYDQSGKLIIQDTASEKSIDVSDLVKGVYLLRIGDQKTLFRIVISE